MALDYEFVSCANDVLLYLIRLSDNLRLVIGLLMVRTLTPHMTVHETIEFMITIMMPMHRE